MLEDHLRNPIKKDERLTGRTVGLFSLGRIALLNDPNTSWMERAIMMVRYKEFLLIEMALFIYFNSLTYHLIDRQ